MRTVSVALASLLVLPLTLCSQARAFESEQELDEHVAEYERIREEQNEYFRLMEDKIRSGEEFDLLGSCTYASSILRAPPAKTVVLTFDDGPTSDLTPEVLGILKKYGIRATFFMKGDHAKMNPSVVRMVKAEGHMVGNHSWDHPDFHRISDGQQASEVTTTDALLRSYMQPLKLFRYPYGNSTCATNVLVKQTMGYDGIVGWHIDSCDWAFSKTGSVTAKQARICEVAPQNASNLVGHVLSEVNRHGGGIILMHEIHTRTVANLETIIVRLRSAGYQFTNLDDPRMAKYFF